MNHISLKQKGDVMEKSYFVKGSELNEDGQIFKKQVLESLCCIVGKAYEEGYTKTDITRVVISTVINLRDLGEFKRMLLKAKMRKKDG